MKKKTQWLIALTTVLVVARPTPRAPPEAL